ncbi:MAG: LysM peptidoglycan-binding domain-containing protein [Bacteroidales bacterium]|nr:LysM peptidoglycan-binding domain-containing protein [Bacteroidales bacterium]
MIKKVWLLLLLNVLFLCNINAQSNVVKDTAKNEETTQVSKDLEIFTNKEVKIMDSLLNVWYIQNELAKKNSILSTLKDDTTAYDNNDSLIFNRLSKIVTEVPLAYNNRVKRFIELYSVQRQRSSSVILGLAQYYYPWMKQIFDKYDVPEEIIYITIIESALNPIAVSPAGATGIWQFMYGTGKLYGLEVNTYVDDRRDPYKATDAAARHFRDLYNIFNDWGLAISAYNCGAGNVRKAIQRSGGKTDFWGVCPYLPKETQNYFPAYIGALYMMNYHNLYGITPAPLTFPTNVDTVMIDKELHLAQVAEVMGLDLKDLTTLNPQYKRNIIPAFNGKQYPLRLPANEVVRFIALKDTIQKYHYDEYFNVTKDLNKVVATDTNSNGEVIVQTTPNKYHTVRKGETLGRIASKYGLTVSKLKSMNRLHSNYLRVGQRLLVKKGTTITKPAPVVAKDTTKTVKDSIPVTNPDTTQVVVKKETTPTTPKTSTPKETIYIVKKGDTLSSIGRKYGKTAQQLAKYNNLRNENSIQVGQKLKIPR